MSSLWSCRISCAKITSSFWEHVHIQATYLIEGLYSSMTYLTFFYKISSNFSLKHDVCHFHKNLILAVWAKGRTFSITYYLSRVFWGLTIARLRTCENYCGLLNFFLYLPTYLKVFFSDSGYFYRNNWKIHRIKYTGQITD